MDDCEARAEQAGSHRCGRPRARVLGLLGLASVAFVPAAALAEDPTWPNFDRPDGWTLQVQPRAWLVSPSGRVKLPSNGAPGSRVRIEDLNLDSPRFEAAGQVDLKLGDWRISFSGLHNDLSEGGGSAAGFQLGDVTVAPGGTFTTSFDFTSLQGSVSYRIWEKDFGADGGTDPHRTMLGLDLLAGARYSDVDFGFTSGATTDNVDEAFGELFGGARAELIIARDFSVEAEVSGGGWSGSDHSVLSIDAVIAFSWRPVDAVGLQIGWRQLAFDLSDGAGAGEFEYSGRLAGVFFGVVLRF